MCNFTHPKDFSFDKPLIERVKRISEITLALWLQGQTQVSSAGGLYATEQQCLKDKLHLVWNATKISAAQLCKL